MKETDRLKVLMFHGKFTNVESSIAQHLSLLGGRGDIAVRGLIITSNWNLVHSAQLSLLHGQEQWGQWLRSRRNPLGLREMR